MARSWTFNIGIGRSHRRGWLWNQGRWYKLWTFQVKFIAACNVTPVTSFDSCFECCSAENNGGRGLYLHIFVFDWFFVSLCQMAKAGGTPCNLLSRKTFGDWFQGHFYQKGSWMIFNVVIHVKLSEIVATCLNTIRVCQHTAHPDREGEHKRTLAFFSTWLSHQIPMGFQENQFILVYCSFLKVSLWPAGQQVGLQCGLRLLWSSLNLSFILLEVESSIESFWASIITI